MAQRLVRKLCPFCKKKVRAKKEVKNLISKEVKNFPLNIKKNIKLSEIYVYEPKGCERCNKVGYSGRIGIFEVLKMTDSLARIILKEPSEVKIEEEAQKQEMLTMRQDGILKALDGITSIEEVLRVSEEK